MVSLSALLPVYSAVTSRMAGGGLGAKYLPKAVPELLFCLPFGYLGFVQYTNHPYAAAVACFTAAFVAHNTGHGTAMHMGGMPETALSGRKQMLSSIVDPICAAANQPLGGVFYCWLFMAIKGFLIGLSTATLLGLSLTLLWPLSYYVGMKLRNGWGQVEYISGACAGLVIFLSLP